MLFFDAAHDFQSYAPPPICRCKELEKHLRNFLPSEEILFVLGEKNLAASPRLLHDRKPSESHIRAMHVSLILYPEPEFNSSKSRSALRR